MLLILLLASAFVGPYLFLFAAKLHFIRFVPLVSILIYSNRKFRMNPKLKLYLIYFSIYFCYTLVISLVRLDSIRGTDVFNFFVLYFFVISVALYSSLDFIKFQKYLFSFLVLFLLAALVFSIYEEVTLNHLSYSAMLVEPKKWPERHFPTMFFTNSNDLAAIVVLSVMYILSALPMKKNGIIMKLIIIVLSAWICFVAESKLAFLVLLIFVFFYLRLWVFHRYIIAAILFVIIFSVAVDPQIILKVENSLFNFSMDEGGSTFERLAVYKYGLYSVIESYGLGLGVGASQIYYMALVGNGLSGITIDPHSYLVELLISSGPIIFGAYVLFNVYLLVALIKSGANYLHILQLGLYHLVLFSSSSSVFLWPHYIFFISYLHFENDRISTTVK